MHETSASFLPSILLFLGAAILAVPIFKRIGLGAILGYLVAGFALGPSGFGLVRDPASILHIAELGVVMLLFVIGLELQLNRLIALRRAIFGLGFLQLSSCAVAIGVFGWALGLGPGGAALAGIALAMSATSIALQTLTERGDLNQPYGQRSFAILLFQDIAVVPILALVPLLAANGHGGGSWIQTAQSAAIMVGAIGAVVLCGRYLLNPFFRILANTGAREVMTAAALLIVLGTALLMQWAGMSMALGAFLAGVLLAESNFRHELEADIEPFRGLLLGLFFMGVGMAIDRRHVLDNALLLGALALALALIKPLAIAALLRLTGSPIRDAVRGGVTLMPAGEFAFVLLPLGASAGLLGAGQAGLLSALAALTMLLASPLGLLTEKLLARFKQDEAGREEDFSDATGKVLVIGFGRFGQVVAQVLRSQGVDMTIIDKDVEMIKVAANFGSKVYYGDGSRPDVLRAAGAANAQVICVAIDDRAATVAIVEIARKEFPLAKIFTRAYDRQHLIALLNAGTDFSIRETFESALGFGRQTLEALGEETSEVEEVIADVRERDWQRVLAQQQGGIYAGMDLIHTKRVLRPEPLEKDRKPALALNEEAIKAAEAEREQGSVGGGI